MDITSGPGSLTIQPFSSRTRPTTFRSSYVKVSKAWLAKYTCYFSDPLILTTFPSGSNWESLVDLSTSPQAFNPTATKKDPGISGEQSDRNAALASAWLILPMVPE